jgi:hypothetical protein
MHLTIEEEKMLEGKYGNAVRKSMEILVRVGKCYDAARMIPIVSAHAGGGRFLAGKAGAMFMSLCRQYLYPSSDG